MTRPLWPGRDIIIVGASAGGVEALSELVRTLPADLPAAVMVVLHIPPTGISVLPAILSRAGKLPALHAKDGMRVEKGQIYVAPPDHHVLLGEDILRLSRGPKENSSRPAVDPLLRTGARQYGARAVGVILSGTLDDGTAGLITLRRHGGLAIVQDPATATFPGMPTSAVENSEPDMILPLGAIGPKLVELATTPFALEEAELNAMADESNDEAFTLAGADHPPMPPDTAASGFTCPECHGALWEMHEGELVRFRCRIGHRYSADTLIAEQTTSLEAALWTALRALEESAAQQRRLAARATVRGQSGMAERFREQAKETEARAAIVRGAMLPEEPPTASGRGNTEADTGATAASQGV